MSSGPEKLVLDLVSARFVIGSSFRIRSVVNEVTPQFQHLIRVFVLFSVKYCVSVVCKSSHSVCVCGIRVVINKIFMKLICAVKSEGPFAFVLVSTHKLHISGMDHF